MKQHHYVLISIGLLVAAAGVYFYLQKRKKEKDQQLGQATKAAKILQMFPISDAPIIP